MRKVNNDEMWIGKRFGRLTVVGIRRVDRNNSHAWHWDCKCDCGNMVYGTIPGSLKSGTKSSCGCLKKEQDMKNLERKTHGKSHSRLYGIWEHIKERCYNENSPAYKNYGGRGISMCDEWHDGFEPFYEWSIKSGYKQGLSIERKDVNAGYCPDNCCWITMEEQAKNKRNIRHVIIDGQKMPLKIACEKLGLPYKAIHLRVTRYGMSFKDAISRPFIDKGTCLSQKCRERGLPYRTVVARIKNGWDEARALSEPIHSKKGSRKK